jgi:hypothetical protein
VHCILAVSSCCGKDLGIITEGGGLIIHFRGGTHSFVCFAGMVDESGAENCSEKALALAVDDVFGNYWCTSNYLSLIFRKVNDFVRRFILDHKSIAFTILVVNFTVSLLFYGFTVDFIILLLKSTISIGKINSETVKSTNVRSKINLCTKSLIIRK